MSVRASAHVCLSTVAFNTALGFVGHCWEVFCRTRGESRVWTSTMLMLFFLLPTTGVVLGMQS
jgi:hypothetical protein